MRNFWSNRKMLGLGVHLSLTKLKPKPVQVLSFSIIIFLLTIANFVSFSQCTSESEYSDKILIHEFDMNSNQIALLPSIKESSENSTQMHQHPHSRSKRFIYYNIDSSLDVGFLLTIPFTIVLPPMTNLFNSWRMATRRKRSLDDDGQDDDGFMNYEDHPVVQGKLDQVKTYFDMIKIPEAHCIQRAICEFSSDPDKYYPLSDMVLGHLQDPNIISYIEEQENPNGTSTSSLYKLLNNAAEIGLTHGHSHCHKLYKFQCPFSTEERLNMPTLQFWKQLNSMIGIKFHNDW